MVGQHFGAAAGEVGHFHADQRFFHRIRLSAAGFFHRFHPHIEADISGFHRVVGNGFAVFFEGFPVFDKGFVGRCVDALEIIPRRQMPHQRLGVDAGKLLFAHRKRNHRNLVGRDALVGQFFIERHVGIAIDGRHHGSVARGAEFFHIGHNRLPIRLAKRRVIHHDVFGGNAFRFQIGFENFIGGARIHIIGAQERKAFHALIEQVIHRRNRLLVGRGAGVENIGGRFLAFPLHGVKQNAVKLFINRQHRFAGYGSPAAESYRHFVFRQQLARFFGKQRPIGSRIHHHRLQLFAQHAAFGVLLVDKHQHRVFQRRLGNRHGAAQRM